MDFLLLRVVVFRTLGSLLSNCFAISSSDGNPPAVTSDARVKVQYDSLLFVAADMVYSITSLHWPPAINLAEVCCELVS